VGLLRDESWQAPKLQRCHANMHETGRSSCVHGRQEMNPQHTHMCHPYHAFRTLTHSFDAPPPDHCPNPSCCASLHPPLQGLTDLAPRLTSLRLSDPQILTDYQSVLSGLTGEPNTELV
jgi:hypothetical protein